jgi:hypothetical protein
MVSRADYSAVLPIVVVDEFTPGPAMLCVDSFKTAWRRMRWYAAGGAWLICIVAGLSLLAGHNTTSGVPGVAPQRWPSGSRISLHGQGHTLVMFAHPRCPCTRASLGELAKILARARGRVSTYVVFFTPSNATDNWDETDQWSAASTMPGVHVVRDIGGSEARLFQATTSGQTLLYDAAGRLQFSGGITIARGHSGDNPGQSSIESLLSNASSEPRATPVYGCPILTPAELN